VNHSASGPLQARDISEILEGFFAKVPNQIVLEPSGAGQHADAQSRLCKPGQTAAARTAMLQPIWPP